MTQPRAWCEIDLGAIGHNVSVIREAVDDGLAAQDLESPRRRPLPKAASLLGRRKRRRAEDDEARVEQFAHHAERHDEGRARGPGASEDGFALADFESEDRARARGRSRRRGRALRGEGGLPRGREVHGTADLPLGPLDTPNTGLIAVLKGDAFGHGASAVAAYLAAIGIETFAVGSVAEALALREAGLRSAILVLGGLADDEIDDVIRQRVTPAVHSTGRARQLNLAARRLHRKIPVHLNVDTGDGRLGVLAERAIPLAQEISASSNLYLEGLFTRLAATRADDVGFTAHQLERFEAVRQALKEREIEPPLVHAAGSAALFGGSGVAGNRVRVGAALYGLGPAGAPIDGLGLEPAFALRSRVAFLKDLAPGQPVGLDQTYTTVEPTRVAVLPIGYQDGLPATIRSADVLIDGRRAPVVGPIAMDSLAVDVTRIPNVQPGSLVTLVGTDGDMRIAAGELAERAGVTATAVSSLTGTRLPRTVRWPEETPRPAVQDAVPATGR